MRKFQIAVVGYNEDTCTDKATSIAYEVGKEVALSGAILICGGLGGVMESACRGAKENNGISVGIVPNEDFSLANQYCDIVICTGLGLARDLIVATSADGIIGIGGGVGTLIELAVGYKIGKKIVVLSGTGGISDKYGGQFLDERKTVPIIVAKDARRAVDIIYKQNYSHSKLKSYY